MPSLIGLYLTPFDSSRDTELVGQVSNILSISLRLGTAQLVVEVSHMQFYL
jgi:hypothetical protein